MTKCSNCKFGMYDQGFVNCQLFFDWLTIEDAENEELTCEGYIDRMDDGRAQKP